MYIAMNRFRICPGSEQEFEQAWAERDSNLKSVPGFIAFHLLRGASTDEYTLYSSHVLWESQAHFEAWTRSEAFRVAHRNAGSRKHLYLGPPQFEGFEVVQSEYMPWVALTPNKGS